MNARGPSLPAYLAQVAAHESSLAAPSLASQSMVTETSEVGTSTPLLISALLGGAARGTEQSVFSSKRAWRACDVFLTPMPTEAGPNVPAGFVSIFIYAHVQGARVLVSSGRISLTPQSGQTIPFNVPVWIAGARMAGATYEVTCCPEDTTASVDPGKLLIVCVCSDSDAPVPAGAGEIQQVRETSFGLAADPVPPPKLELVGLSANSQAGAAAWVHVHDFPTPPANANGSTPLVSYALDTLAAGGGFSIVDRDVRVRVRGSLVVVLSSTRTLTTGAAGGLSLTMR